MNFIHSMLKINTILCDTRTQSQILVINKNAFYLVFSWHIAFINVDF